MFIIIKKEINGKNNDYNLHKFRVIPAYLDLELDHEVWCVKKHNMACDIQLVVFPNNTELLSYFSITN